VELPFFGLPAPLPNFLQDVSVPSAAQEFLPITVEFGLVALSPLIHL
jgi:hypothetical protein